MKTFKKIFAAGIVFMFMFSFALSAFADNPAVRICSTSSSAYSKSSDVLPLIQCGSYGEHCCDFKEAMILVSRIINWFISISVTVAAVTFSIAGAKILMNPANPGERETAIKMFQKTIIGMVIVLCSWLVIHTIVTLLVKNSDSALYFLNQH